ncbi:ATP-dependent dethiobiotin synthetase BioD [Gammaproteobacteria bacterium]
MGIKQPSRGLFVTATDTGVGKTALGVAVIGHLTAQRVVVRPRKPLESGCHETTTGLLLPADAEALQQAAGNREALARVCPWPLAAPLSPERAATLVGLSLTLDDLTTACRAGVECGDFLWVEGAGGFLSPLAPGVRNAELAVALGLPVVLVVADRLGCLNHTLLTVEAITARGLRLAAVILNRCGAAPVPGMDNAADLQRWLGPTIYCLPELPMSASPVGPRLQSLLESFLLSALFPTCNN